MIAQPRSVADPAPEAPPPRPHGDGFRRLAASLAARTLIVFVLVSLALLGLTVQRAWSGLDVAEERASERAESTGQFAAQAVLDEVGRVRDTAAILEQLPDFWSGSEADRDAKLAAFAAAQPALQSLGFVDAALQQRGLSNHIPGEERPSLAGRAYAREALASDRLAVTAEPLRSFLTGEPILPIAVPIVDRTPGGSQDRGLLIGSLALSRLPRIWDNLDLPPGSATFLIDAREGHILAGSGWAADRIGDRVGPEDLAWIRAGKGSERVVVPGEADHLRAAAPIEPTSWIVVVDLPLATILDPIRAAALRDAGIALLVSLAALVLLILLWRELAQRLRALRSALARWSAGDRAYRARIGGADEIAELGWAFDQMADRLEDAVAVTAEMTRELDLTRLLDLIIRRAADLIGVRSGMIQIWDDAEQALVPRAWYGFGDWVGDLRIPLGQGIGGTVAARREGLIVNDFRGSPYAPSEIIARTQVGAVIAEPLIYHGQLVGVIDLDDAGAPRQFSTEDRQILRPFADQAAIAIAHAQLYQDLANRLARFQTVTRLNQVIATSLDMDEVLWEIARAASQFLDAPMVSFWIADDAQERLDLRISVLAAASVGDYPIPSLAYGEGAIGWIAQQRRPLLIPDVFADDRVAVPARDWWRSRGLCSFYGLPIVLEGRLLAVLTLGRGAPFRGSEADREMLDGLITQAAAAIRNAGLYAALTAANADLERAVRHNELILNSAGEGILGVDTAGYTTFANPAVERLTGYRPDEIVGRRAHDVLHHSLPDGTPLPIEACRTHQEREAGSEDFVTRTTYWRKDGTSFAAEVSNSAIRDGDTVLGGVITFRDVTERQAVERLKDEFISVVSHELKTPLTSIRGSLGLLAAGVLGPLPDAGRRMVEIAVSNTDRLVRLINDILDTERMEAGRMSFERRECDLGDLMERAGETMAPAAEQAGVALDVDRAAVRLWADPDRLDQVLTNLLSNAIKFSHPGGRVRLGARREVGTVLIWVADEGRGIPADKLESIFGRFQQVDASDSREKGGTGLGLAICRGIVEQHGGRIWAESRVGAGATFYCRLPALPLDPANPAPADASADDPGGE